MCYELPGEPLPAPGSSWPVRHRTVYLLHMGAEATRTYGVLAQLPLVQQWMVLGESGLLVPEYVTPDNVVFNHCWQGWERQLRARMPLGRIAKIGMEIEVLPEQYVVCGRRNHQ